MANTARDLIKCRISNDPGTSGNFTLSTAFTNSLLPAAADDGLAFKLNITENGVGTEIRRNCTYTHSTTTFGRGTMVRSTAAADAALNFTAAAIVSVVPSAEDYPVIVRANVIVNDSSSGAKAANTTELERIAAVVAATTGSKLAVTTPDGVVHYNAPIVWTADAGSASYSTTSVAQSNWPTFISDGTTTWVSSQSRNGADWVFQNAGYEGVNLKFVNQRWAGPGVTVRDTGAVVTGVSAAATAFDLPAGTSIEAGDAICVTLDNSSSYDVAPSWWATVTSVSGTNPITVNFANQPLGGAVTAGNIVTVFRNQCAVQIGGYSSARQDIFFNTSFERCAFIDYFSAIRINDCTFQSFKQNWVNRCMFGIEFGYNIDTTTIELHSHQCQYPARSATFTSASTTVTFSDTDKILVGMSLNNAGAAVAATLPDHAVVVDVVDGTTVTMSHPSSASVTRDTIMTMGIAIAIGKGHGPWYPLQPSGVGGDGARTNTDTLNINNIICNGVRAIVSAEGVLSGQWNIVGMYSELNQRLMWYGAPGGPTGQPNVNLSNVVVHGAAVLTGPAIQCGGGNGGLITLHGVVADVAAPRVPLIDFRNFAGPILFYKENYWGTTVAPITAQYYYQGLYPAVYTSCRFELASPLDTGHVRALGTVSGSQTNELNQVDLLTATLSGNTTIANPPWGSGAANSAAQGKRLRMLFQQNGTGGYTITLGTLFCSAAAAALGTSAAGTASQCMVLEFVWRGTKWVLTAGAFSWADA